MSQLKHTFPEMKTATQTHTIEVEKLKEIESITVDGGSVEVSKVEDNLVTLQFRARSWDRRVQTGGSYTAADSKYVTAQRSRYYNSGGYSGTLSEYVYSGSYTPSDSKTVTEKDIGTKESTASIYRGGRWEQQAVGTDLTVTSINYNRSGYSGTLRRTGSFVDVDIVDNPPSNPSEGDTYTTYFTYYYNFTGIVTKPAIDTRVYRYRGTVRRPASDTRTWDYYYQYTATINYIEKGFEIQTKIDGQLRTANEGWVKINGQLRPIEYIYTKIDGKIVEVD